jgi:hypothetical protein
MGLKITKFAGKKDFGDKTSTKPPYLREMENVDLDDEGQTISRRDGFGAELISSTGYHSLWHNAAQTLMLGVNGTSLELIDPSVPSTTVIRTGLTSGLRMDYAEINEQIYYSNGQVLGFVDYQMDGTFPTVTKFGSSSMVPGQLLEFLDDRLYTALGDRLAHSESLDFGRAVARTEFHGFPGTITMLKSVADGMYLSYGNSTVFLVGTKPEEFVVKPVADYSAIPYTAFKFDASLVSSNVPLQGDAVFWQSTEGPCIGFQGGQMLNLALTKVVPQTGITGASVLRENRKGFMQAVSVIQE